MSIHKYDPDLPYVVETTQTGRVVARFGWRDEAEGFLGLLHIGGFVVDTTPQPRVPEDARFITWLGHGSSRWYAEKLPNGTWHADDGGQGDLEDLPGVTPDTVFTVLEERRS